MNGQNDLYLVRPPLGRVVCYLCLNANSCGPKPMPGPDASTLLDGPNNEAMQVLFDVTLTKTSLDEDFCLKLQHRSSVTWPYGDRNLENLKRTSRPEL